MTKVKSNKKTATDANTVLGAVNSKSIKQVLTDMLVGKTIRIWKREYKEYEYGLYDVKPQFNYDIFFFGDGQESVICEIVDLQIKETQNYSIRLILNDNGEHASLIGLKLSTCLQFV
jgi:hypothetical protein